MTAAPRALPGRGRFRTPFNMTPGQLLILLLIVGGMGFLGFWLFQRFVGDGSPPAPAFQTTTVTRRTIESIVNATGTVAATRQVRLNALSAGRVQEVYVRQGDRVTEGQPLARLDDVLLEVARDQARSNLDTAQFRLQQLLDGPTTADVAQAQQSVAQAQSTLTKAQNDLFNLLAGATQDEVNAARSALDRARANLDVAQTNYDKLVNRTDLTLRPEWSTLQTARSNYQTALSNYSTRTAPANALDVSTAQASLTGAQSQLDAARAKLAQLQAGPDALDVATARNAVLSAQQSLQAAEVRLRDAQGGSQSGGADVAGAQARVQSAQTALQTAQTVNGACASDRNQCLVTQAGLVGGQLTCAQAQQGGFPTPTPPPPTINTTVLTQLCANAQANAQQAIAAARASLSEAQAALVRAQTSAGPNATTVANAQQQYAQAQSALVQAQANLVKAQQNAGNINEIAQRQQALAAAESQLATAQNNLRKAQEGATATDLAAAQQAVATAETGLRNAQNALQKLTQPPTASDLSSAQQAVTQAETQVRTSRNNLDKLLAGASQEDIASARAALENARSSLDTAQTNWDRLVSGSDIEQRSEYTALVSARNDFQQALSTYNTRTAPPKPGDVAALQGAVDAAGSLVNSSLARLAQVVGGALPTELGVAREAVETAELALKQAQYNLDNAVIKAPFSGTIATVSVNPGDSVTTATNVFSLLDPNLIRVDATVDESNVVRLRAGMTVTVTFDSIQGRQFQGTVATVTPSGVTTQGVVTYPVTIVFNSQGFNIPPGATANLRIVTEARQNVLVVPTRAIVRENRQAGVRVPGPDDTQVFKPITTGISGDNFTEVTSGLEEGERIIIPTPGSTTPATGGFGGQQGGPPGGAPGAAPTPQRR